MRLVRRLLTIVTLVVATTVVPVAKVVTGHMPLVEACSGFQLLNSAPVTSSGGGLLGTIKLWQNCSNGKVHADMSNAFSSPPTPGFVVEGELDYNSTVMVGPWTSGPDSNTTEVWAGHICYTAFGYADDNISPTLLGSNSTTACV